MTKNQKAIRVDAVIIAKNSEASIASCLEALEPIVDGVVVLDTGSDDRTLAIAKCYTTRAYESKTDWSGIPFHFSQARNEALSYCEQGPDNWVLSVDADEVAVGTRPGILDVLNDAPGDVFTVLNQTNSVLLNKIGMGDKAGRAFRGCRLFRNNGDYHWQYRVHEMIARKDQSGTPNHPLPEGALYLMHTRDDITESLNRNIELLQMALKEEREAVRTG